MKKVIAFDIDDTLNVAKTPMSSEMAATFAELLDHYTVCVISGQKLSQFMIQILAPMGLLATTPRLRNLHLMVAQGTQYYTYNGPENGQAVDMDNWKQVYSFPMTDEQTTKIEKAIETAAKELDFWCADPAGEIIENRSSQVTYSALGQSASPEDKYPWDPEHKKREAIVAKARQLAPEFDYEVAGTTSINVFLPGMNKTFGMTKLMEYLKL
ncbi:MAG: HAD-IIB family hydrolase, partial [Candidatus Saccharibacteria bacterium]|nr:HAD-IIB family hydrolase [Candidatus Saccharibacteria bacterium]